MAGFSTVIPHRYRRPELLSGIILVAALAAAEYAAGAGLVSPILLKRPTVIFHQLLLSLGTPGVQADLGATAERVVVAFVISAVLGGGLAVLFWRRETLRRAYLPLLGAIFGTPIVLLYVMFVVMLGRGSAAIIAISVPVGVIPIIINATDALANVEVVYVNVARSFNASGQQLFRKVILPDAAPDIFAGVRIGFSYIVISVTAVEFLLGIDKGLGGLISGAYFRFNTTQMFVGITLVIIIVIIAIFILRQVEAAIRR